jgi:glycosyltransferase involved in cell wall biosynthesis
MNPWPPVSVVMAVRDEEANLAAAVDRILAQAYEGPLELVVAVGPSRDGTLRIARQLEESHGQVHVVDNPAGITPAGLNAAIRAARHDVIVRVDGHSFLPERYVERVVGLLAETGADNVGGVMAAAGHTAFERAVAAAMRSPLGIGGARFHTGGDAGPADTVYLGTFRRQALDRVGGYDERFVRAQDWELNYRLRATGGTVWFAPDLHVGYRPRGGLRALARQFFDTGRWRRYVARAHRGSLNARDLAPPLALIGVVGGALVGVLWPPALLLPAGYLLLLVGGAVVIGRRDGIGAIVRLPLVMAVMHLCWGAGFLIGPPREPTQ